MFALAKIKQKRKNHGLVKMISDSKFSGFDIGSFHVVDYSPSTLLESDQIYVLKNFPKYKFFPEWLKSDIDSKEFDSIEVKDFDNLSYIVNVDSNQNLYFQLASKNSYFRKKSFLEFGEDVKVETKKTIFIFHDIPDAFYDSASKNLYFRSLSKISSFFKEASSLYRDATQNEVDDFLRQRFITLNNGFSNEGVSILNRRKIALATNSFMKLGLMERIKIIDEIKEYHPEIYDENTGKFIIGSDQDLRYFLYGVDERFYTTSSSGQKRLANSVISV